MPALLKRAQQQPKRPHHKKAGGEEEGMRLMVASIQLLYELGRPAHAAPLVAWFYPPAPRSVPFHVFLLLYGDLPIDRPCPICHEYALIAPHNRVNLQIATRQYDTAKDLIQAYLATPKASEKVPCQHLISYLCTHEANPMILQGKEKSLDLTTQQQATLADLLICHVLLPLKQHGQARATLATLHAALPQEDFLVRLPLLAMLP